MIIVIKIENLMKSFQTIVFENFEQIVNSFVI